MLRISTLQRIIDRKITQTEGGDLLNISSRQIRRLLRRYKSEGPHGLLPRFQGSNRKIPEETKNKAIGLVKEKYYDFGPTFAAEKLREVEELKVSKETLRQWMIQSELWRSKERKAKRIHQSRERRPRFGELVQIDGSHHDWFEGRSPKCSLIVMIDDATSKIIHMRFEPSETTFGYMRCIRSHIEKYGLPIAYYSDRHSIFRTTREECSKKGYADTQLHRALKDLKIELICAYSAQAKGRVERANGVLQDRLIKEMRLRGVSTIAAGNEYIEEFMLDHNRRFSVSPKNPEDAHRACLKTADEIELILSHQMVRKVNKNLEFSFENKIYQIEGVGKGYRLQQGHVIIYESAFGFTKILNSETELKYKILRENQGPSICDSKDLNLKIDTILSHRNSRCYPQGPHPSPPRPID